METLHFSLYTLHSPPETLAFCPSYWRHCITFCTGSSGTLHSVLETLALCTGDSGILNFAFGRGVSRITHSVLESLALCSPYWRFWHSVLLYYYYILWHSAFCKRLWHIVLETEAFCILHCSSGNSGTLHSVEENLAFCILHSVMAFCIGDSGNLHSVLHAASGIPHVVVKTLALCILYTV